MGGVDWCQQEEGWRSLIEAHCTRAHAGSCVRFDEDLYSLGAERRLSCTDWLFESKLQFQIENQMLRVIIYNFTHYNVSLP